MHSLPLLLALLVFGCVPQSVISAADDSANPAGGTTAVNDRDRALLIESCHRIACTIQATDQVLPRLDDDAAKDLLGVIKKDTEAMHRDLALLMQDKGIGIPMLEKGYREDVARLGKAEKIAAYSAYRDHQLAVTQDLAETLDQAAKDGEDADVRAFAVKWRPSVGHHHQILKKYEPVR